MFAIEFTEANLPEILQTPDLSVIGAQNLTDLLLAKPEKYYFIRNYVDHRGRQCGWTFIPEFVLQDAFDFDPEKIKTEWDQIVHKS